MSISGEKPSQRFTNGEMLPNAERLYQEFKARPDYQQRLLETTRYFLFQERKQQINKPEIKTQQEFGQHVLELHAKIYQLGTVEQVTQLAKEWGITLDQNHASRWAFASYIYHDSQWSGVKIDENSFIITDGR